MKYTDSHRKQHSDILSKVKEINLLLESKQIIENTDDIILKLTQLVGALNTHLEMEDRHLYPTLLKSNDNRVKQKTLNYINEMTLITMSYKDYIVKWNNNVAIQNNPTEFIKETREMFHAIRQRIEKENNELFKLVDRLL